MKIAKGQWYTRSNEVGVAYVAGSDLEHEDLVLAPWEGNAIAAAKEALNDDAIVTLIEDHLRHYPEDVFAGPAYEVLRWKLRQIIADIEEGRHLRGDG